MKSHLKQPAKPKESRLRGRMRKHVKRLANTYKLKADLHKFMDDFRRARHPFIPKFVYHWKWLGEKLLPFSLEEKLGHYYIVDIRTRKWVRAFSRDGQVVENPNK